MSRLERRQRECDRIERLLDSELFADAIRRQAREVAAPRNPHVVADRRFLGLLVEGWVRLAGGDPADVA